MIVNTASDIRRWEYDFTVSGAFDLTDLKSRLIAAMKSAPGTLSKPAPEALISDLSDLRAGTLKIRALWWTRAPRQHQRLASYDAVLTAIQRALSERETTSAEDRNRAA